VLDPIGLFSGSTLVEFDSHDERVLEASSALAAILREYLPAADARLGERSAARLARVLLDKLWSRRGELQRFSLLIFSEVLRQTSKRAEAAGSRGARGTRDTRQQQQQQPAVFAAATRASSPAVSAAAAGRRELSKDIDVISETVLANASDRNKLSRADKARAILQEVRSAY
jgi:hypothetical protein